MEAAATLRASKLDAFVTVALPLARRGLLTAAVLGFAHTIGEFGVVLMIGGGIPGETKVLSIAIYDFVETLRWREAHLLAGDAGVLLRGDPRDDAAGRAGLAGQGMRRSQAARGVISRVKMGSIY